MATHNFSKATFSPSSTFFSIVYLFTVFIEKYDSFISKVFKPPSVPVNPWISVDSFFFSAFSTASKQPRGDSSSLFADISRSVSFWKTLSRKMSGTVVVTRSSFNLFSHQSYWNSKQVFNCFLRILSLFALDTPEFLCATERWMTRPCLVKL